jgi:fatty acyl-CoA reductase
VYQCCSGSGNPILIGDFIRLLQGAIPNPDGRDARWGGGVERPAADGGRGRRNARHGKTARHADAGIIFSFYAQPRYRLHNTELLALAKRFGDEATSLYPVDARLIRWEDYLCRIHMTGLNRYARRCKDPVPAAVAIDTAAAVQPAISEPEAVG